MPQVLRRGTIVKFNKDEEYKIERIHSIEPDRVIYEVSGYGYKRLLADNEIWNVEDDDATNRWQEVIELYDYSLDFDTGIISEHTAYAIKVPGIHHADGENRYLIFSPTYKGFRRERDLEVISTSYQLFLKEKNFDRAHISIAHAVYDRYMYFKEKTELYDSLVNKLSV